jgi:hypothetical protein
MRKWQGITRFPGSGAAIIGNDEKTYVVEQWVADLQ